jgi:TM2 domain-containing membrane protein YozV
MPWREGQPNMSNTVPGAEKKIAAGICGILLGALGVHKFILGYTKQGLIMLLVTVLTLGFAGFITGIIGLIEGIIYLTKSDADFVATYVQGRKGWF